MAAAFGVHLGSTSACLAVFKDGKTDVEANEAGDRVTPAIVGFTDHDEVVGPSAKHGLMRNAQNTVCNVKQVIGRDYNDPEVARYKEQNQVKVTENNGFPSFRVTYKEEDRQFSPRHVASLVYKHLRETAARHGEGDIHDAVIAVPTNFNQQQKQHLREAASHAGFSVLRMISEPAAAALAYNIGQDDPHCNCQVLVYRLGGCSLDVSVVSVNSGMYSLTASVSDSSVNGHAFTQLVTQHFATEFKRSTRQDMTDNKRSMCKLRAASELCKHILTRVHTAQSFVESLYEGIDYNCQMSRARFEGLCSSLVQKCLQPISKVLSEAGLKPTDIDKVVLCGGGSKMPCLQQAIKDYFKSSEILNSIVPDEVIALGAATQASLLTGTDDECALVETNTELPCLDRPIVAQVNCGEELQLIISRWTPIPCRRQLHLPVVEGSCRVLIGEAPSDGELSIENTLAQLTLDDLSEVEEVLAIFHFRSDGSLHATLVEKVGNKTESVIIETS